MRVLDYPMRESDIIFVEYKYHTDWVFNLDFLDPKYFKNITPLANIQIVTDYVDFWERENNCSYAERTEIIVQRRAELFERVRKREGKRQRNRERKVKFGKSSVIKGKSKLEEGTTVENKELGGVGDILNININTNTISKKKINHINEEILGMDVDNGQELSSEQEILSKEEKISINNYPDINNKDSLIIKLPLNPSLLLYENPIICGLCSNQIIKTPRFKCPCLNVIYIYIYIYTCR